MTSDPPTRRTHDNPGHAHELRFSCYHNYKLLDTERTCHWLAEAIQAARAELDFALWAYVFMPEHVHLIVCPRRDDYELTSIFRAIKEPVERRAASYVSRHAPAWLATIAPHRAPGADRRFWHRGDGSDQKITEPKTLYAMIDYLHLNPVRRGLVDRPRDWGWSSAGWFEGLEGSTLLPDRIPPEWTPPLDS